MNSTMDVEYRLFDYFAVIGVDHTGSQSKGVVLSRYPVTDWPDFEMPTALPLFACPSGVDISHVSLDNRKPFFFSYSLTGGDGGRAYGVCLNFYERDGDKMDSSNRQLYSPKVLTIVSHFPYYNLMMGILREIYSFAVTGKSAGFSDSLRSSDFFSKLTHRGSICIPDGEDNTQDFGYQIESLVEKLIQSVVYPESPMYLVLDIGSKRLSMVRPPLKALPYVDDHVFQILFHCLDADNVAFIIACMMSEQRILLHSKCFETLTGACEALVSLLFPWVWPHIYIPLLPLQLIEYLQAPVPFIMGVHTDYLETKEGLDCLSTCVIVHLDFNRCVTPIELYGGLDQIPEIPLFLREHIILCMLRIPPLETAFLTGDTKLDNEYMEFEVTFGPGPYGLKLEHSWGRIENEISEMQSLRLPHTDYATSVVVKDFTMNSIGEQASARNCVYLRKGSFLLSINGVSVLTQSFDQTIKMLLEAARPSILRFANGRVPLSQIIAAVDNAYLTRLHIIKYASQAFVSSIVDTAISSISNSRDSAVKEHRHSLPPLSQSPRAGTYNMKRRTSLASAASSTGAFPPRLRRRMGSNNSISNVSEVMQAVKRSRPSDNSWVDDVRIGFLECMLFIMWDYRKFIKRGWYKSSQPTFDSKGFCKSFRDRLVAMEEEIELEKREAIVSDLSGDELEQFLDKEMEEREHRGNQEKFTANSTFMDIASKTQAFISFIEDVMHTGDQDEEILLFNGYLDLTQGRRPGDDKESLQALISRKYWQLPKDRLYLTSQSRTPPTSPPTTSDAVGSSGPVESWSDLSPFPSLVFSPPPTITVTSPRRSSLEHFLGGSAEVVETRERVSSLIDVSNRKKLSNRRTKRMDDLVPTAASSPSKGVLSTKSLFAMHVGPVKSGSLVSYDEDLEMSEMSEYFDHENEENVDDNGVSNYESLKSDTAPSSPTRYSPVYPKKGGEEKENASGGVMSGLFNWARADGVSQKKVASDVAANMAPVDVTAAEAKKTSHSRWGSFLKVPEFKPAEPAHPTVLTPANSSVSIASSGVHKEVDKNIVSDMQTGTPSSVTTRGTDTIGTISETAESPSSPSLPPDTIKTDLKSLPAPVVGTLPAALNIGNTWASTKTLFNAFVSSARTGSPTKSTSLASPAKSVGDHIAVELRTEPDDGKDKERYDEEKEAALARLRLSTVGSVPGDDL